MPSAVPTLPPCALSIAFSTFSPVPRGFPGVACDGVSDGAEGDAVGAGATTSLEAGLLSSALEHAGSATIMIAKKCAQIFDLIRLCVPSFRATFERAEDFWLRRIYGTSGSPFSAILTAMTRKVVVTRPEPPSDSDSPAKMSREEMRALLAVTETDHQSALGKVYRRGRVAVLPTGLVSLGVHLLLGSISQWLSLAVLLAGILWTAWPLFRRDDPWSSSG